MRLGIVGYGVVGQYLERLFTPTPYLDGIVVYDVNRKRSKRATQKAAINRCDLVFIAVPTPTSSAGLCDLSAVEEVVSWVTPPMCIKSTVVPGTTDRLASETGKKIVFSPEYIGETPFHLSKQITSCDLVAVGGEAATCDLFIKLYQLVLGPEPHYFRTTAATAELAKYMENCFFATKVSFAAQFCLLATAFGADFTVMREIWVADRRVGRSHSTVIGSLGFGGKCLPKDLRAIISWAKEVGANPMLLEAIQEFNESIQQLNQG